MNGFKQFINEQDNLDEDFRKWALKAATPFVIAGSLMGGPSKSQAQDSTKKQPIVMAFDKETGKMVKTPINQATFDQTQKKWIKSSDKSPNQPNTASKNQPDKDKNIDAGEHSVNMATSHYDEKNVYNHEAHAFYSSIIPEDEPTTIRELTKWLKETPVEKITLAQAEILAKKKLLNKNTFDKLYKLHIQPFLNKNKIKNKENWLYIGDYHHKIADGLDNIKKLGIEYGYPSFNFIEKSSTNESYINTAMDLATQYMGVPGPTELGLDIDAKQIGNFGNFVASRMNLIPLSPEATTKYQKLCKSEPQNGIDFYKHQYNKLKACRILCKKNKSKSDCIDGKCKLKKFRSGSTYYCPPTPYDFERDNQGNIIGLS